MPQKQAAEKAEAEAAAAAKAMAEAEAAYKAAVDAGAKAKLLEEQTRLQEEARLAELKSKEMEELMAKHTATGVLLVTVIECTQLKSMDGRWGKNDVYAIVRISPTLFKRTVTLDESGATPGTLLPT